jgi:hypothetical protein
MHDSFRFSRRAGLAALALTPFANASGGSDDQLCAKCKTTGWIPNPAYATRKDYEGDCVYCSVVIDADPKGGGFEQIPCPDCLAPSKAEAAKREHSGRLAKQGEWRTRMREIEKQAGSSAIHSESKHFYLTFDLPKVMIGKVAYDRHRAMHLYLKRAEDLFAEIMAFHGISDAEVGSTVKHHIAMFERQSHAMALSPHLTNLNLQGGAKAFKIGPEKSATVAWDDPRFVKSGGDEARHQFFTHLVAHHAYHDMKAYKWWLYDRHGWVFEATSFYWEYRKFGSPFVNCAQEQQGGPLDMTHTFESTVRKLVNGGSAPSLASIVERNCSSLSLTERQCAWSYVDFLNFKDPKAFKTFLFRLLENEVAARDALKEAYGFSLPQVQEQWEAFVKANYSVKDRKGPLIHSVK